MSEDSITSSPSKSNKSIPEPILVRKNERNKADDILQLTSDHEQIVDLHEVIQHFYYDSYDEYSENAAQNSKSLVAKPPAIIKNYKPFEMERSLAIADHMSRYQIEQNKRNVWPEKQGFSTCKSLIELGREQKLNDISDNYNKKNAFFITESALMFCDNIEKTLQYNTSKEIDNANSIAEELSPKNNYVFFGNSLLEDFSPSPLSKEQTRINTSYQYTPEFRLRRPEKTYSRKFLNTTKRNLNKRFEEQTSTISDDDHSNLYSLSIQDNFTIGELSKNHDATPTNTNDTELFCDDNLLNLSVNFTQNLLSEKTSDLYYDLYNSFEEFHEFRSQRDAERAAIDIENEKGNQYTPEFRLRRPEKTYSRKFLNTAKTNLNKRFEEQTSAVSDDDHSNLYSLSVQDNFTIGELSNNHDATPTNTNNIQRFCDDNILNLSVNFTQNNQILSDDCQYDLQQYTNLFSNKMSDLYYDLYNSFEEFHEFRSQRNAGRAVIDIENDKENATYEGWNDVDYNEFAVKKSPSNNENPTVPVNFRQDLTPNNTVGFKTASTKPIKVSREANITAAKILSKLPKIPAIKKYVDGNNCDTGNVNEDVSKFFENIEGYDWNDDSDLFKNFQTPITSKGKHATEQVQQHKTNVLQIPQQVQVVPSTSKMGAQGFKTAGGKNVHISKKALDSVQKLLKEFASDNKDNYNSEEDLKEIKCKVYAKTHNFKSKQSSLRDIKEINVENKEQIIGSNLGFQTAKENATYEGWNEDDYNDVFANINTENILHDQNKKQENVLESPNNNDNSTVPVNLRRDLTSNNSKILSKLPDIPAIENNAAANNCDTRNFIADVNIFEPEDFEWNDGCDLSQNFPTQITSKVKHETLSEWPINSNNIIQQNVTPKPMIGKRKHSVDNSDINSSNPSDKERIVSPILKSTYNCRPSGLRRICGMLKKTEK